MKLSYNAMPFLSLTTSYQVLLIHVAFINKTVFSFFKDFIPSLSHLESRKFDERPDDMNLVVQSILR